MHFTSHYIVKCIVVNILLPYNIYSVHKFIFGRFIIWTIFFLCVLSSSLLNMFQSYLFSFLDDEFYNWSSQVLPQTYLETEYEVPLNEFWLSRPCYTYLEDNIPFQSDNSFFKKKLLLSVKKNQTTTKLFGCSAGWYINNTRAYRHIH